MIINGSITGLSGPITASHIHRGALGVLGVVVKSLTVTGNDISATWSTCDATESLTAALITEALNGGLYVNVHTAVSPNGEARGQLLVKL